MTYRSLLILSILALLLSACGPAAAPSANVQATVDAAIAATQVAGEQQRAAIETAVAATVQANAGRIALNETPQPAPAGDAAAAPAPVATATPGAGGVTPSLPTPLPAATATPTETPLPTATPTITPTPTPLPDAVVRSDGAVNLRGGPGTVYAVVGRYPNGTALRVVGKLAAGGWLKVAGPDGKEGWMATSLLTVNVDLGQVVAAAVPPTPSAPQAQLVRTLALHDEMQKRGISLSGGSITAAALSADAASFALGDRGGGLSLWKTADGAWQGGTEYVRDWPVADLSLRGERLAFTTRDHAGNVNIASGSHDLVNADSFGSDLRGYGKKVDLNPADSDVYLVVDDRGISIGRVGSRTLQECVAQSWAGFRAARWVESNRIMAVKRYAARLYDVVGGSACLELNTSAAFEGLQSRGDSPYPEDAEISRRGKYVAIIPEFRQPDAVMVFDGATGKQVAALAQTGVFALAFHPSERYLLTSSGKGDVRLWDVLTGKEVLRLPGHTAGVTGLDFDATGRTVLTVDAGGAARIWELTLP